MKVTLDNTNFTYLVTTHGKRWVAITQHRDLCLLVIATSCDEITIFWYAGLFTHSNSETHKSWLGCPSLW